MGADHRPVRSWICGSRLHGHLPTADIPVAGTPATTALRATADRVARLVMVARTRRRATVAVVVRALRAAADTPRVEAAAIPPAAVAADTPAVAAATPVEAITRRLQEQVVVNEVKTEARRGGLKRHALFLWQKFQGFRGFKVSRSTQSALETLKP